MPPVQDPSLPQGLRDWPGIPLSEYGEPDDPHHCDFVNDLPSDTGKGPDAPIWQLYNEKGEELDEELIETHNSAMDNLLIFAALFSAIVTAFLMISLPLLQPDNSQAMVDGITALSLQLAALGTTGMPMPPSFQADATFSAPINALWVNAFWLLSLMISLSTSVLAMLIKQWLRAYVTDLPSAPRERAHHRQFRLDGVLIWHVPAVASALPILIHVAVGLFLTGLILYLCNISLPLGVVMGTIFGAGSFGYFVLAIAPLIWVQCPYKSPLTEVSDYLSSWFLGMLSRTLISSGFSLALSHPHETRVRARIDTFLKTKDDQFDELSLAWLACTTTDIQDSLAIAMAYFNLDEFVIGENEMKISQAARNRSMRLLHLPQLQSPHIVLPSSATWSEVKEVLIGMAMARSFNFWESHHTWSLRALHWAWSLPLDPIPEGDRLLYYALMLHCLGPQYSVLDPQVYKLSLIWINRASSYFLMDLQDPTRSLSSFGCTLFMAFLDRCRNRERQFYQDLIDILRKPVADCIGASASLPLAFLGWAAVIWASQPSKIRAALDPREAHPQCPPSQEVEVIRDSILIPLISSEVHDFMEEAAMRYAVTEMKLGIPDCLAPVDGLRLILQWFRDNGYLYPQRTARLDAVADVAIHHPAEINFLCRCVEAHSVKRYEWTIELVQACQLLDVESEWWKDLCRAVDGWWGIENVHHLMEALVHLTSAGRQYRDRQTIRIGLQLFPLLLKAGQHSRFRSTRFSTLKQHIEVWLGTLVQYGVVEVVLQDKDRCDILFEFLSELLRGPDLELADAVASSSILNLLIRHSEHENLLGLSSLKLLMADFVHMSRTVTTSTDTSGASLSTEALYPWRGSSLLQNLTQADMLEMGQLKPQSDNEQYAHQNRMRRWSTITR